MLGIFILWLGRLYLTWRYKDNNMKNCIVINVIVFFCLDFLCVCHNDRDHIYSPWIWNPFIFRVTIIVRSWFVFVVILIPGISVTSLNNRMVVIEFWFNCTVIGKKFRVAFLLKLCRPLFVNTLSFSWFLHVLIYFTKFVLFETLFVEHVSSIAHVCLISSQLCVRITATCAIFLQVWFVHWSNYCLFCWHE